jgi:UDP-glucuronate decarboxylase
MTADGVHEPVNLGNPVEFTIRELADEVFRVVGSEVRVTYRPLPEDDPTKRKPDITRARERLGWEPKVTLAEGLAHTVAYFRSREAREFRAGSAFQELARTREPDTE